ncbi:uncharacterized [Tachysurus ichikawai]
MLSHPTTIFPEHVCHLPLKIDAYLPLISMPTEEKPNHPPPKASQPWHRREQSRIPAYTKSSLALNQATPSTLITCITLSYTPCDTGFCAGALLFSSSEEAGPKTRPLTFTCPQ